MPRFLPRKRRWRVLIALAVALAVAWFVLPQLLVPTIQRKLQAMIASQLKVDVKIEALRYSPPYGVRVRGVSVVANDPEHGRVEVLKVGVLDLKLAKLPFGKGPLLIENVTVRDPELHLVIAGGELVGRGHIVRPEKLHPISTAEVAKEIAGASTEAPSKELEEIVPAKTKLSEMFLLRHFGLHGGRVVVENRDVAGAAPMVWRALDAEMETAPQSKSAYGFAFGSDPAGPADVSARGAFDLDELWVQLDEFRLSVTADDAAKQSGLPAKVQDLLARYKVQGRVAIDLAGRVPVRDLRNSRYDGSLELTGASAAVPGRDDLRLDRLDARVTFTKGPAPGGEAGRSGPTVVKLERFTAAAGPARVTASLAAGVIDAPNRTWSVRDLRAGIAFAPAPLTRPASGPAADPAANTVSAATQPSFVGPLGATGEASLRLSCGGKLGVRPADGGIDPDGLTLEFDARGMTVQPPKFAGPFRDVNVTVRKSTGTRAISLKGATLAYGGDRYHMTGARLVIPPDPRTLRESFRLEEITGSAVGGEPRLPYPGGFGRVLDKLKPSGEFLIGGGSWFSLSRYVVDPPSAPPGTSPASTAPAAPVVRRKPDFFFSISSDTGSLDLFNGRLPLINLRGDATVSPLMVRVDGARANAYGGTVVGSFHAALSQPRSFEGSASVTDAQLRAVGEAFKLDERHREKLQGKAFLNVGFAGQFPTKGSDAWLDTLRADGQFEVFGGQFWTLPVLGHIVERSKRNPGTVGEAAGRFEVTGRRVELRNAAVQSPALGLLGSGSIGFDKSLDLKVIVAPLGDWRDRMKRGGIPILSDVAGEVFGTIQKVLNAATSTLLYEFHVKGTLKEPKVDTVPAPVLTEPAALLLGQMVRDAEGKERSKWSATAKKKQ